ncbi:RNA polymerase sigma factor SigK [Streptomyces sp. ADI96-02]|uniref:sigma factor n=1 Tax=unclassified Streptomyces TaxID=2593676 RepID=UPI000F558BAD|nr:sigma factor [Streptomyces sp. ADI96-02]RPK54860.1 RNA polymerase sigma factor SigK [Streptomyces sp. ADI96-02]
MNHRSTGTSSGLRRISPYTPAPEHACPVGETSGTSLDDLLVQVAHGGRSAFSTLYDLTAPMLWGIARERAEPGTPVEDQLRAIYARIWKHAPSYRPGPHAIAWLVHEATALPGR